MMIFRLYPVDKSRVDGGRDVDETVDDKHLKKD